MTKRSWERQQARRCVRSHRTRSPPHFLMFLLLSSLLQTPLLSLSWKQTHSPPVPLFQPPYALSSHLSRSLATAAPFIASHNYFNKRRNHLADTFLDHKMPSEGFGISVFYWSLFSLIKWAKALVSCEERERGGWGRWSGVVGVLVRGWNVIRSLRRISLNGTCGRRTGTTE